MGKGKQIRRARGKGEGMNNWVEIYKILWKQYVIKFRIWMLFFLLSAAFVGIYRYIDPSDEAYRGISVGVCIEDEKGRELLEKLEKENGIFRFLLCVGEQEMIRQIENGTLECGYVLPQGFYDNLLQGKVTRQITLYYSPASAAHKISYEVVFADLFEILSQDILKEYLRENGSYKGVEQKEAVERLLDLNARYAGDGSTFHFVYETTKDQAPPDRPENLNILRGCVGVVIFFMSLLGLANCLEQENTWKAVPGNLGKRLRSGCIHVAVLGSVLFGSLSLWILRMETNFLKEVKGLLLYFVLLELFVRALGFFLKNSRAVYGMLPVMMLGCCIFCPVFIRIERYLPGAEWISRMFPVTYYLKMYFI